MLLWLWLGRRADFCPSLPFIGSSQARGQIEVVAGLRQSQQHWIWAISATYAVDYGNAESLTHWARPGIEPASSWTLVRFSTHWAITRTPISYYSCVIYLLPVFSSLLLSPSLLLLSLVFTTSKDPTFFLYGPWVLRAHLCPTATFILKADIGLSISQPLLFHIILTHLPRVAGTHVLWNKSACSGCQSLHCPDTDATAHEFREFTPLKSSP